MNQLNALLIFSPFLIALFWALTTAASILVTKAWFKIPLLLFLVVATLAMTASASVYFLDYRYFIAIYVPAVFFTLSLFPLFHLYISSLTYEEPLTTGIWLQHLTVPVLGAIIAFLFHFVVMEPSQRMEWAVYLLSNRGSGEGVILSAAFLDSVFRKYFLISAIFYFWLTDRRIRQHRKALDHYFSNTEMAEVHWFKVYRIAFLFTLIAAFLYFTLSRSFASNHPLVAEMSHLLLAVFFWIIGYYGQSQAIIYPVSAKGESLPGKSETVSAQHLDALLTKLNEVMVKRELFTRRDLTLPGLARVLGTNRTYLSRLFNEHLQMSFNHYINQLRIEYYIKSVNEGDYNNPGDLWLLCGFNSASSFYRWFQLLKGISPAAYLKDLEQQKRETA